MLIVDDEMFALCFLSSASMVLWLNDAAFDIDMLLFPPLRAASAPLILLVCLLFCCVLKLVPPASRPPSALPFFWAAVFDWCWKEERVGPVVGSPPSIPLLAFPVCSVTLPYPLVISSALLSALRFSRLS